MPKIGERFGRWTVKRTDVDFKKHRRVECLCDCGSRRNVLVSSLRNGSSTSCGCFQRENSREIHTKHGSSHTREYHIWENMKSRCLNPTVAEYKYYGQRGITLCPRWMSFENFIEDMGRAPSSLHTIDRINNDGHYEAANCRWATRKEQANNTRRNRFLTIDGVSKTLSEWAELSNTNQVLISQRLSRGWTDQEAVFGRGGMLRSNRSGYRGVSWHKGAGKWHASVSINGRNVYLGLFERPDDAHAAYVAAKADGTPVYRNERD